MEDTEKNKTWQEKVAAEVLSIAVAIKAQGEKKHDVKIGIDAAVQAAGMVYCCERTHEYRKSDDTEKERVRAFEHEKVAPRTTKPE